MRPANTEGLSTLALKLPAEVRAKLQKLADADERDLGTYVRRVLAQHVKNSQ